MNTTLGSPGPRYQATLQLLRTAETLWEGSRRLFDRWDLSPSQFNILNLLSDQPEGVSQVELSRQLIMHRSNVTGLVDRLESRLLVKRLETPGDRRAYRVVLTEAGRQLIAQVLPHYYQAAEAVWGKLSVKRANAIAENLARVIETAARLADKVAGEDGRPAPK